MIYTRTVAAYNPEGSLTSITDKDMVTAITAMQRMVKKKQSSEA
jgi:hypothetical protein